MNFNAKNNKEMLERAMSEAIVSWVKRENPHLTKDEIMTKAMELLDAWDVVDSELIEDNDNWTYRLRARMVGIVIGAKGKQINFILQETKKLIKHSFEFRLEEVKESDLYWAMNGYFLLKDWNQGCL